MTQLYAQGDILIERVGDAAPSDGPISTPLREIVLAEGELTGHRHRVVGDASLFSDAAVTDEVPPSLYVAHLRVNGAGARIEHEEHAPIYLGQGTYRVRRQRQLQPADLFESSFITIED